jgi:hypothetical protein
MTPYDYSCGVFAFFAIIKNYTKFVENNIINLNLL